MPKFSLTRRQLLAAAAPIVASVPLIKYGLDTASAQELTPTSDDLDPHDHTNAAHIGAEVPAPGEPGDLDALLYPVPATPHAPSTLKEYDFVAIDTDIEVAPGIFFPAWTYNGTVPGPVIRVTENDQLRVNFSNAGSHPHTIHFHGIHPANMDGVFEVVDPGETFVYEFPARPWGLHLYHCHSTPLKKHLHKGLYGAFIIDPPEPRAPAQEFVMVMNGFDTDGDGGNNFYTVNGKSFFYAKYPIIVKKNETVRIYLVNVTEFDLINSFHLHGDMFKLYRTGTTMDYEFTDTVMLCQGERAILEIDFSNTGVFMFHAHQAEFAELGWMGYFNVVE